MKFLPNTTVTAGLLSVFSLVSTPIHAEGFSLSLHPESEERFVPDIVEKHIVFALDVSGSVKYHERSAMQEGIAKAILDEACGLNFDGFSRYALTIVYYADRASSFDTIIVSSQKDAVSQISHRLWNFNSETPVQTMSGVGSGTNILEAIDHIDEIFSNELDDGYQSVLKSVLIIGDESPHDMASTYAGITGLAQNHRATVYALPLIIGVSQDGISNNDVYSSFNNSVRTPSGLLYHGDGYPLRVLPGEIFGITEPEGIFPAVIEAMSLSNG